MARIYGKKYGPSRESSNVIKHAHMLRGVTLELTLVARPPFTAPSPAHALLCFEANVRIFLQLLVASWHRKRQRQLLLVLLLPVRTGPEA